jgi:hypothetical protein
MGIGIDRNRLMLAMAGGFFHFHHKLRRLLAGSRGDLHALRMGKG